MAKFNISDLRTMVPEILQLAKTEAVEIEKHGKPSLVILDAMKYKEFVDYVEDLEDRLSILEQKLDPDQEFQEWDKVKQDLGLK